MRTAADALDVLTRAAGELIIFATSGERGALEQAAAKRALHYLDAAQMLAEELSIPCNREALEELRRQVLQMELAIARR